jgi:hypothetical protein
MAARRTNVLPFSQHLHYINSFSGKGKKGKDIPITGRGGP